MDRERGSTFSFVVCADERFVPYRPDDLAAIAGSAVGVFVPLEEGGVEEVDAFGA